MSDYDYSAREAFMDDVKSRTLVTRTSKHYKHSYGTPMSKIKKERAKVMNANDPIISKEEFYAKSKEDRIAYWRESLPHHYYEDYMEAWNCTKPSVYSLVSAYGLSGLALSSNSKVGKQKSAQLARKKAIALESGAAAPSKPVEPVVKPIEDGFKITVKGTYKAEDLAMRMLRIIDLLEDDKKFSVDLRLSEQAEGLTYVTNLSGVFTGSPKRVASIAETLVQDSIYTIVFKIEEVKAEA